MGVGVSEVKMKYIPVLGRIVIFKRIRIRIIFVNKVLDEYEYEYYSASGKLFEYIRIVSIIRIFEYIRIFGASISDITQKCIGFL